MSLHSLLPQLGNQTMGSLLQNGRETADAARRIYGVVPARVLKIHDPKNNRHMQGYVQIWFPWLQQEDDPKLFKPWARAVAADAGNKDSTGFKMSPNAAPQDGGEPTKVGDEVLVAFEHGDPHVPYVLGTLWNKQQNVPTPSTPADGNDCPGNNGGPTLTTPAYGGNSLSGGGGKNKVMYWKSRKGQLVVMDDEDGTVRINDCTGNSCIQLEKDQILLLQRSSDLHLWAANSITINCETFVSDASSDIYFNAGNDISFNAKGKVTQVVASTTKTNSGADTAVCSKANVGVRDMSNVSITTGAALTIASKSEDVKVEAGGCLTFTAAAEIFASTDAKCNFEGKAVVSIMSPAECAFVAGSNFIAQGAVILLN